MASRGGSTSMHFPRGGGRPRGAAGRIQRAKTHVIPFTDRAGRQALIVFYGRESCPLPPLFGFAMYFTHPDATPDTVKPVELMEAIKRKTPLENGCSIRLELYFDAVTDDDCIAHYLREKAARGDYRRQIQNLETSDDTEGQQGGVGRLPGLVPSYIDVPDVEYHHGVLFNYPGADWRTDKLPARRIFFDPISEEEYARTGESDVLPPVYVSSMPVQASDTAEDGVSFVGMAMFELSNARTKNETTGPWQDAIERGWTSW
ncbi:hypothetical protein C7974DRAFT_359651 [Boeremia exigua]|uniref:uncharacterized protein n=1 Tax=Boeremia exigua TaxID=749465 RepID=UPI001E8DA265|nr:uncharacterized protein C7974DRAFT_359651 [Boeremia exigua]KAH6629706.1 hypothetical protein C7974DRAFT_359651 [Boeremia exigua]